MTSTKVYIQNKNKALVLLEEIKELIENYVEEDKTICWSYTGAMDKVNKDLEKIHYYLKGN